MHACMCMCVRTFPKTPMAFDPRIMVGASATSASSLLPLSVMTASCWKGWSSEPIRSWALLPCTRICRYKKKVSVTSE